jgi:hypothetical protein
VGPDEATAWKERLLEELFKALSAHAPLRDVLVFKGARVLHALLDGLGRASLDIDSNLLESFAAATPDREGQAAFLESEIRLAVSRYFEAQEPVRHSLDTVRVRPSPPAAHPRGWNAFEVGIKVNDHARPAVRNLPNLRLDVAAPERLRENSIARIEVGGHAVWAYTLERMAGEKLRAFLSTLPAYRRKIRKPGEAVRVKDLYDLARIARRQPTTDERFWGQAGEELRLACGSRYIDCEGLSTFAENLGTTRASYEKDPTLPEDIGFEEAWDTVRQIVEVLERRRIIPFSFPLERDEESGAVTDRTATRASPD